MSVLLLLSSFAGADEGMWLPEQLPAMGPMLQEMGLEIPPEQLADPQAEPLSAIVSLGFCSASFLSPDGLVATNHHCVSGYLSYASDAEHTYARDGFLAVDRSAEISAGPAARLYVVESITDVTAQINGKLKKRTKDVKRYQIVDKSKKLLISQCEAQANHRCEVASYYGGQQYRLISKLEIQDVRMVYAPPESVGSYGGEIDNWMWPRHAGDFSLLRAYVAPDGSSAPFSADNVPYQPKTHLKVDPTGADPGEFVMIAGYPGSTYRYRTARQMRFAEEVSYPYSIALSQEIIALLKAEAATGDEASGRLNSSIDQVANGLKYRQGNLDNFAGSDVVGRKQAQWAELEAWIAADPKRTKLYGPVLAEMDEMQAETEASFEADTTIGYLRWLSDNLGVAHRAYRFSVEAAKPDLERDRGYQARDLERTQQRFDAMDGTYWEPADKQLTELTLKRLMALPPEKLPVGMAEHVAAAGGVDALLQTLFAQGSVPDAATRKAWLEMDRAQLEAMDNPWMQLAVLLETKTLAPQRAKDKARSGASLRLQPLYMEALLQSGDQVYPDANGTLRISVGHIEGYSPADAIEYMPQTTVAGMAAKAGEWPFDAPTRLLDAAASSPQSRFADPALGDVPVDFLSTLDSTGGNSGSATLNSKGEFVGFLFDGNYEAMSADWLFDPELTRSIHVDVRYMLWVLEVEGADHLLDELGLSEK